MNLFFVFVHIIKPFKYEHFIYLFFRLPSQHFQPQMTEANIPMLEKNLISTIRSVYINHPNHRTDHYLRKLKQDRLKIYKMLSHRGLASGSTKVGSCRKQLSRIIFERIILTLIISIQELGDNDEIVKEANLLDLVHQGNLRVSSFNWLCNVFTHTHIHRNILSSQEEIFAEVYLVYGVCVL